MATGMTKAKRLELAAAEAPILRNATEKTLSRRIGVVGRDGKVTYVSGRDVLRSLAKVHDLEHAVDGATRLETFICNNCGKTVKVKASGKGKPRGTKAQSGAVPTVCYASDGGCFRQTSCVGYGRTEGNCTNPIPAARFHASEVRRRGGGPALCTSCAGRKGKAEMDPDRMRAAIGKAVQACRLTPEEIAERAKSPAAKPGRKGHRRLSQEERSDSARRAARSSPLVAENLRRLNEAMTPERRKAASRKANETKAAKPGARPPVERASSCAGWGETEGRCRKVPPRGAYCTREVASRGGGPWRCHACANSKIKPLALATRRTRRAASQ